MIGPLGKRSIEADVRRLRGLLGRAGLSQPGGWLPFGAYNVLGGAPITSAGPNFRPWSATVPRALTVRQWDQRVNPQATNDGSNYWVLNLIGDVTGSLAILNTSGLTAAVSAVLTFPAIDTTLSSSETWLRIDLTPIGSPGPIYVSAPCVWVI